jgi:antitoxin VapB
MTAENPPRRAKLFWNGRSQAVRLPQEFRFEGDEVEIRRDGELVVLTPIVRSRFEPRFWRNLDRMAAGTEIADAEPLGGRLLDLESSDAGE